MQLSAFHTLLVKYWNCFFQKIILILKVGLKSSFSGTIEKLIVNNVTNGETSLIGEFTVTDKFNADEFLIHILFETVCNYSNYLIV